MPAVLVIVATALSGAGATIAGIAIALGLVPYQELEGGIFAAYRGPEFGWIGIIAAIALAFAGAIYQTRTVADMSASITEDKYMNPGVGSRPAGGAPA
jgi:hypothetical protein